MKEAEQIKHDIDLALNQMEKLLQQIQKKMVEIHELLEKYEKKTGNRQERKEELRRWNKF